MPNNKFCIESGRGIKYRDFGISVAVNDKHLVIGNPTENCLLVYSSNVFGKWIEARKIFPPIDSLSHKFGLGFGVNFQLDEDALVTNFKTSKPQSSRLNSLGVYSQRCLIKLNEGDDFKPVRQIMEKKEGKIRFNLLFGGKIKSFVFLDNDEPNFGCYGRAIAIHSNLLLIGSPYYKSNKSRAWLIDVDRPKNRPIRLEAANSVFGHAVAISQKFALATAGSKWYSRPYDKLPISPRPRTLIRSINTGCSSVIDNLGLLSLSDNTLALFRSRTAGRFNSSLRLYHLDKDATPHPIEKRRWLERGWVQNGYLITVEQSRETSTRKVCVESIN